MASAASCLTTRVLATSQFAHGVDLTTVATLEFADGALGQISCSMGTAYHRQASIIGHVFWDDALSAVLGYARGRRPLRPALIRCVRR